MNAPKPQLRTILTEDGELKEVDDDLGETLAVHPSPVFCNHCGTANQVGSSFCRTCGQSLDEQVIDAASLQSYPSPQKRKRDALFRPNVSQGQSTAQVIGLVISDIVSLVIMSGLAYWTLRLGQGGVTVVIIIAWFFIEMARHGWTKSK